MPQKNSRPKVSTKKLQKNNNGKEITFMLSSASWTRSLGINFVVLLQKSENFSSERER